MKQLSGLRFFLSLHILIMHTIPVAYLPKELTTIVNSGQVGTSLFIVLSGFILSFVYVKKDIVLKNFMFKRVTKLYPLHVIMIFVSLLLVLTPYFYKESIAQNALNWNDFYLTVNLPLAVITQLLMIDCLNPFFNGVNGPGWTLSCLFLCYTIFPQLLRISGKLKLRGVLIALLVSWIALLASPLITIALGFPDCLTNMQVDIFSLENVLAGLLHRNPLVRLPEFLIGILLYRLYEKRNDFNLKISPTLVITTILVAMYFLPLNYPYVILHNGLYMPFEMILIWSLLLSEGPVTNFLSKSFIVKLGNASFSLYLLHIPLYNIWINADKFVYCLATSHKGIPMRDFLAKVFGPTDHTMGAISYITFLIFIITLSLLTQKYFVESVNDWLRKKFA
ncbi:MAG: acyltransferase [Bacteroidota bacterium]|nr:acyltransferase [Bacteroidota bacterium]